MKNYYLFFLLFISFGIYSQEETNIEASGIEIVFSAEGNIFPEHWTRPKINGTANSLAEAKQAQAMAILTNALNKYPLSVLQKNLKKIYVLDSIAFYNQGYGGTYYNDVIYLSLKNNTPSYTNNYVEKVFHAEFSSILLHNYKDLFLMESWLHLNPKDFNYGGSGVAALKSGKSGENFDQLLNEIGFINEYATSNQENEFNAFVKNMFLPSTDFNAVITKHTILKIKRLLVIQFYQQIDPAFNEVFFDHL